MNRTGIKRFLLILVLCLSMLLPSAQTRAEELYLTPSPYTAEELDNLLAPIALYPDPLLAEILPASTYPQEIADADAWLQGGGTLSGIDGQNWDESVKAVAHYPDILEMMAGNMDWTADLGDAFLNQPEDVAGAIQRLRSQALGAGNLQSNDKQEVDLDGENIEIIPAQPDTIYVPFYDPGVVYIQRWTGGPLFVTFGRRLLIGGWLGMDFDWRQRRVIYHGWNRPGWVNHARPYVHVSNVYIDRSRPLIRQTWRHDASRGDPGRYRASRPGGARTGAHGRTPEIRGRETTPARPAGVIFGPRGAASTFSNRGKASLGTIKGQRTPAVRLGRQPSPPAPGTVQRPLTPAPRISGSAPGQPAMPASGRIQRPAPPAPRISSSTPRQPSLPASGRIQRPAPPAPRIGGSPPRPRPERESVRPAGTPSVTFGGYRGAGETKTESLRGQASRRSTPGVRPPSAPEGRGVPLGKQRR